MKRMIILTMLLLILSAQSAVSQVNVNTGDSPDKQDSKLIDLNRNYLLPKLLPFLNSEKFQMKQSYSMFYSSGYNGGMKGMYTNTMYYQFSDKMDMRLQLNFMMQPGWLQSQSNLNSNMNNRVFLPNLDLRYKPTKNTFLQFSYRSTSPYLWGNPYYNYNYSPFQSMFWRDEYGLW